MVFVARIKVDGFDFGSDYNLNRFKLWARDNVGKTVHIEHKPPTRSRSQNNYYWVYMDAVSRETGHTAEELHQWAKRQFLPRKFATIMGKEVELVPSTKTLSKVEFGEFLERICAETGVPLPDPQAAGYIANR